VNPPDFPLDTPGSIVHIHRETNLVIFENRKGPFMIPTTRWNFPRPDGDAERALREELSVEPLTSRILVNRGIVDTDRAKKFFNPVLADLHNPFLMVDMKRGVDRVVEALYRKEPLAVYGDYDADGITSTVCLVKFLREIHPRVSYYIPHRLSEGYGLNREAVDDIRSRGARLIITVDCGITDHDAIEYARSTGVDTVILDHHKVPDSLPRAAAVINPQRSDCPFPFKYMAAVGIVFNFLIALRGTLRTAGFWTGRPYPNLREYLDLVTIGTLGDISPLLDENRIFVKIGMDLINEGKRPGIRALKDRATYAPSGPLDAVDVSFYLVPRINAAGRLGSAEDAVRLLLTDDPLEAARLAERLDGFNRERQEIERNIFEDILLRMRSDESLRKRGFLVFASESWHPGVIGIVASKLVDRFYRPAILISLREGIGKGSGRSIAEFNLYEWLKKSCEPFLLGYGGHRYAAGLSIREEDIDELSSTLNKAILESIHLSELIPRTSIDAECGLEEIGWKLMEDFAKLAPFGNANPEPVLCARDIRVTSPVVLKNNHLKMQVQDRETSHGSIWFKKAHLFRQMSCGDRMDIAFTPQTNRWNGVSTIQLKLRDAAVSS